MGPAASLCISGAERIGIKRSRRRTSRRGRSGLTRPLKSSRGKSLSGAGRVAQDKRSRQLLSFSGAKCGIQDKVHGRLLRLEHILALTGMLNESSSRVEVCVCVPVPWRRRF